MLDGQGVFYPRWLGLLLRAVILLELAWVLTGCGSGSHSTGGDSLPTVTVTIDRSQQFQRVEGFGAELNAWNSAGHSCPGAQDTVPDSDKTKILDLLYSDLGLTTNRPYVSYDTVGTAFSRFQNQAPTFAQIAQRVQVNGDQFRYNLGGFVTSPLRDSSGRLTSSGATTYATWATSLLQNMASQLGIVVSHWDIVPEPDGVGSLTTGELHELVGLTGSAFRSAGLTTAISMPRTYTVADVANYAKPILSDSSTLQYVDQIDFHEYDYDASQGQNPDIADRHTARDLARQYELSVAMREASSDVKQNRTTFWNGTYDQAMAWANDVMTDMIEADAGAWDLILAFYIRNNPNFGVDSYIITHYTNCVYTSFEIPPHYWTLRQFVKFVRPGAVRIAASSNSPDIRVAAFTDSKRQETILVAINNDAVNNRGIKITGVPNGSVSVTQTTQTQNGAQLPQVTTQNGQLMATLATRSVTTFVFGP